jgi:hypothetical protein
VVLCVFIFSRLFYSYLTSIDASFNVPSTELVALHPTPETAARPLVDPIAESGIHHVYFCYLELRGCGYTSCKQDDEDPFSHDGFAKIPPSLGGFSITWICSRTRIWPVCIIPTNNNFICESIIKRDKHTWDTGRISNRTIIELHGWFAYIHPYISPHFFFTFLSTQRLSGRDRSLAIRPPIVHFLLCEMYFLFSLVWCPGEDKRIAPLFLLHGCRKRLLKDL